MRRVLLRSGLYAGNIVWVDDAGNIVGIAQGGMPGAEPGISSARERDIMSRLPDADVVGLVGPGVVPGGEKAVGAQRMEAEGARKVQPVPAETFRPLGGAQQNNRGNIRIVPLKVSVTLGDSDFIASVIETPKANGDDAEVLSVQLGLALPPQLTDPNDPLASSVIPIQVNAIVEWGLGGANFTAICDWNQGTSFAVSASFLRISAQVMRVGALASPLDITLSGALGYGNPSSLNVSSPLRFTQQMGVQTGPNFPPLILAGALSAIVSIPAWAVGVTLVDAGTDAGKTPVAPDYTIFILDGANATNIMAEYRVLDRTNQANQVEGQFPIPGRARFIQIQNNLLVDMSSPKLIFNLAF